jgi:hypothetical protein
MTPNSFHHVAKSRVDHKSELTMFRQRCQVTYRCISRSKYAEAMVISHNRSAKLPPGFTTPVKTVEVSASGALG